MTFTFDGNANHVVDPPLAVSHVAKPDGTATANGPSVFKVPVPPVSNSLKQTKYGPVAAAKLIPPTPVPGLAVEELFHGSPAARIPAVLNQIVSVPKSAQQVTVTVPLSADAPWVTNAPLIAMPRLFCGWIMMPLLSSPRPELRLNVLLAIPMTQLKVDVPVTSNIFLPVLNEVVERTDACPEAVLDANILALVNVIDAALSVADHVVVCAAWVALSAY